MVTANNYQCKIRNLVHEPILVWKVDALLLVQKEAPRVTRPFIAHDGVSSNVIPFGLYLNFKYNFLLSRDSVKYR
jgi:hypothetical protein